jgi:hypothetical protein
VALSTTESNELAGGVGDVVAHLNARFATLTYQPVVFLHTDELTFSQYLALLTVADAFLVTSLREGMALRTHEFVECQVERHRPLILSEVSRPLRGGDFVAHRLFFSLLDRIATAGSARASPSTRGTPARRRRLSTGYVVIHGILSFRK